MYTCGKGRGDTNMFQIDVDGNIHCLYIFPGIYGPLLLRGIENLFSNFVKEYTLGMFGICRGGLGICSGSVKG